jgi:signal transduction histidine kinase
MERLREARRLAFTRPVPFENEMRVLGKDGKYRWFLFRYKPLLDVAGKIDRWYMAALEIDDRKQAENVRLEERTRIARELHDTMLQSFQAVLLKFHGVTYQLSDRPELQRTLEGVIDLARQAVNEGRDAVQGLRSSTIVTNDLARAIRILCAELEDQADTHTPVFRVNVKGTPRDLAPILRDDIYRIAGEAVRNAFRHAHAGSIEVEIQYDYRKLRLRIRDDGEGIDPKVLESGARAGHYGLPGLQERAKLVNGKLTILSDPGSGTEIQLTIPASIVYAASGGRRAILRRKSAS